MVDWATQMSCKVLVTTWIVSKEAEFTQIGETLATIREEMMMNLLMCLWWTRWETSNGRANQALRRREEATHNQERMDAVGSNVTEILDSQTKSMDESISSLRNEFKVISIGQPLKTI